MLSPVIGVAFCVLKFSDCAVWRGNDEAGYLVSYLLLLPCSEPEFDASMRKVFSSRAFWWMWAVVWCEGVSFGWMWEVCLEWWHTYVLLVDGDLAR